MPITWQEARTKVRGDLWRPSVAALPDDVCDRALHASLLEIESQRRWLWLQAAARTPADIPAAIASAETNRTLQLHETIVLSGACAWISGTYLKNDADEARHRRAFERGIDRLMNVEDDARADETGGLIQPDTSWQEMAYGR